MTEHGDQCVDTEAIDLASDKIADSGLRYTEEGGGLRLCQATRLDQPAQANHQIRPNFEIRGLFS
jgi:hypothetical protein